MLLSVLTCACLLSVHAAHMCTHSVSYTQPSACDQQSSRLPCSCHLHHRSQMPPGSSLAAFLRDYLTKHMQQASQVISGLLCCTAVDGSAPESDAGSSNSSSRDKGLRTCCMQGPSEIQLGWWQGSQLLSDIVLQAVTGYRAALSLSSSSCAQNEVHQPLGRN